MSAIVEATVPADQFALGRTFTLEPDAAFRTVGLVAHERGQVMPLLWSEHEETDRLIGVIKRDHSVRTVNRLSDVDGACLLQIDWGSPTRGLVSTLDEANASILNASGYHGSWQLQLFFPDHHRRAAIHEFGADTVGDLSIDRIHCLSESAADGSLGLTERQHETVVTAYNAGYYDVPRTVSLTELAEEFDVSHQALSERLRRAHGTMVTNELYHRVRQSESPVSPRCAARTVSDVR